MPAGRFPCSKTSNSNKQQQRRSVQLSITNEIQMKALCLFLICVALLVTYASAYRYDAMQMSCIKGCNRLKAHHLAVEACSKRCRQPPPISQVNPWTSSNDAVIDWSTPKLPVRKFSQCRDQCHNGRCWKMCTKNQRPATAALSDNASCIRYGGCDHRGCWTRCRKN